ncbi:hypothetical protein [Nostoc sp.]
MLTHHCSLLDFYASQYSLLVLFRNQIGVLTDIGAFFGSGLAESNEAKVTLGFLEAWSNTHKNLDE